MNGWDPTVRAVSHDDFCECTFTTYCSWVVEYLWKHVSTIFGIFVNGNDSPHTGRAS